ncbi:MAG: ester cyclase [Acidobacteriota bacterium]|nr:ester cyclase [Acidobacteriota bacterium]
MRFGKIGIDFNGAFQPASGNRVTIELAGFFLFGSWENAGKIVAERACFDNEILMRQIRGEADAPNGIGLAELSRAVTSSGS